LVPIQIPKNKETILSFFKGTMVWHNLVSLLTEARKHFAILALRHHVRPSWDCYLKEVNEKKVQLSNPVELFCGIT